MFLIDYFKSIDSYIEEFEYLYVVCDLMLSIGVISFDVALLLFVTMNKIPVIVATSTKKKSSESIDFEQELRVLKDKLDLDMITEEEYKDKREEIINKL